MVSLWGAASIWGDMLASDKCIAHWHETGTKFILVNTQNTWTKQSWLLGSLVLEQWFSGLTAYNNNWENFKIYRFLDLTFRYFDLVVQRWRPAIGTFGKILQMLCHVWNVQVLEYFLIAWNDVIMMLFKWCSNISDFYLENTRP